MNEERPEPAPAAQVLEAQPAVVRATITITRAGTGKVETFDIIGTPAAPDADQTPEGD